MFDCTKMAFLFMEGKQVDVYLTWMNSLMVCRELYLYFFLWSLVFLSSIYVVELIF